MMRSVLERLALLSKTNLEVAMAIESPCIRNCCLDQNDICVGCLRSLDDILAWGSALDREKLAILQQVEERLLQRNAAQK